MRLDRGWERPLPTPAQLRADVLAGIAAALVCVGSVAVYRSFGPMEEPSHGAESYVWFAAAGLALAGRRRFPLSVLLVEAAIFVVIGERFEDLGVVLSIQMVFFAALYAAWAWSRRPVALMMTSAVVVLGMLGWLIWSFGRPDVLSGGASPGPLPRDVALVIYTLSVNLIYFFGGIAWGHAAWMSARRRAVIEEQLERERGQQEAERGRAVQSERVRIARDLHDVVAHHVSSIGIQATGARRVLAVDPEAASTALGTIESSSRQAVSQMHQLVGLLRSGDEDPDGVRPPQPGLEDLQGLADPDGSPAVEVHVVGDPVGVTPAVGLTIYRVAQEAVTNARRHAHARRVTLTLRHVGDDVELEVIDDGRGSVGSAGDDGSGGFGLSGIRERVAVLDGVCDIGDRPQGGFRVRVRMPKEGA